MGIACIPNIYKYTNEVHEWALLVSLIFTNMQMRYTRGALMVSPFLL